MIDISEMNGESEIPKKLYLLDSEIDSVHKNVEILLAKLAPLLHHMPCKKEKSSLITTVRAEIQEEIDNVRRIAYNLESLIDRLEI